MAGIANQIDPGNILNSLVEGVIVCNREQRIVYANEGAVRLMGRALKGCPWGEVFVGLDLEEMERGGLSRQYALPTKRYLEVEVQPWAQEKGAAESVLCVIRDITAWRCRESMARRQLDCFQQYLDVASVILVAVDVQGRIGLMNRKGCELLGCREEEVMAKQWFDRFVPPEYRVLAKRRFFHVLGKEGKLAGYTEMPVVTLRGERRWIAWHHAFLRNGHNQVVGVLGSGQDVTERHDAEVALKKSQKDLAVERARLKRLASKLTLAEEGGRRHMATALHDEIGQGLFMTDLKLRQLKSQMPELRDNQALDEAMQMVQDTLRDTRSLTFDLSYPILYELGFEKAVAGWLKQQIEDKHAIATELIDDGLEKPLAEDMKVLLFRDLRELLFNVIKHAQATQVKVVIKRVDQGIQVCVEDNGCGFDPRRCLCADEGCDGFGLFSIRQRLEDLGGCMRVESAPQQGCRVTMIAPLKD